MKVILHDFENGKDHPFDGTHVENSSRLREILDALQRRDPFILQIEGENGFNLTVGIGEPVSCIQHGSNDGEPPYLFAVMKSASQIANDTEYVFFCGGQETPIPSSRCVPFEVLQSVASHFLQTGSRSNDVAWIEI